MKKFLFLMSALIGINAAYSIYANVFASNSGFLSNSAMSFFTKEDWKISLHAQDKALNHLKDGVRLAWMNPNTGTHGVFVPLHTLHQHGSLCRDLSIIHTANLVNDKARYRFCKMHDEWKIV